MIKINCGHRVVQHVQDIQTACRKAVFMSLTRSVQQFLGGHSSRMLNEVYSVRTATLDSMRSELFGEDT